MEFVELKIPYNPRKKDGYWDQGDCGNFLYQVADGVLQNEDGRQFFNQSAVKKYMKSAGLRFPTKDELESFKPNTLPGYVRASGMLLSPGTEMDIWIVGAPPVKYSLVSIREKKPRGIVVIPDPKFYFSAIGIRGA